MTFIDSDEAISITPYDKISLVSVIKVLWERIK